MSGRGRAVAAALAVFGAAALASSSRADDLVVWELAPSGRVDAPRGAPRGLLPVGSLAKPFVARAWAIAHPGRATPVVRCAGGEACWLPAGHGTVGLPGAVAVSCNAYFRALAADTPAEVLGETLRPRPAPPEPLTPDGAIGLPTPGGSLAAEPDDLLRAYAAPRPRAVGPRRGGAARGARGDARLGAPGHGEGARRPRLPREDGHGAGARRPSAGDVGMGRRRGSRRPRVPRSPPRRHRPPRRAGPRAIPRRRLVGAAAGAVEPAREGAVRVALFGALSPRRVLARNLGDAPVAGPRGSFVGPAGSVDLRPGDRLGESDWELQVPAFGLRRRLRGSVRADAGPRDTLRLRADVAPAEYVAGVLAAELPPGPDERRVPLGATVLRFLAQGPRHGEADVCDLTHCAWFVGRGPRVAWPTPGRPVHFERPGEDRAAAPIGEDEWARMQALAREDGPDRWTSHCGGAPLPAAKVWGGSDHRVFACARHATTDRASWSRSWGTAEVARAFGGRVASLRVEDVGDDPWRLVVTTDAGRLSLSWDEAHARLAALLGWDALPSPADRVVPDGRGFRAEGRGLGHRVGLCLGAAPAGPLLD
ncbi:MAG: hypothetical protein U0599_07310 [Vicinamibacteria bacterium]